MASIDTLIMSSKRPDIGWFIGPDSEWFWAMLQFLVVAVTLVLIYRQIKLQSQANMLTTLFVLRSRWESPATTVSRAAVCQRYLQSANRRGFGSDEECVATFFEDIGVYLKNGAFTSRVMWDQYSFYVEHYWPILSPLISEFRTATTDDSWFENFESLHRAMEKLSKRRKLAVAPKTAAQLRHFAKDELLANKQQQVQPKAPRNRGIIGWLKHVVCSERTA